MVPSNAHELTAAAMTEQLMIPMLAQKAQNPQSLDLWTLHHNKVVYYEEPLDGKPKFMPDVAFHHRNEGLFFIEVKFKQPWDDLVQKVEYMVQGKECWGVLVVIINEVDKWSGPKRRAATGDFAAKDDWFAQADAHQIDNPYGPVSVKGKDWTKAVEVELYFFPHDWKRADAPPTKV
jgi:hypothetical protein